MITDILVEPVGKEFDTARIAAHLAAQPHTARDDVRDDMFMLAETDEELADAREGDPGAARPGADRDFLPDRP